jgi:hypothetical protein
VGQLGGLSLNFSTIFKPMRRSSSRVIAVALAAGVVLSACSSTDRSAAPAEVDVITEQVTESVEELASDSDADAPREGEASPELEGDPEGERVESSIRGSRVCVINARSSNDVRTPRINVQFTRADRVSTQNELVAPGDQRCGEGAYLLTAPQDVKGEIYIMYTDAQAMDIYANNLLVGFPAVEINKKDTPLICARSRDEGEKSVYDDGVVRYTTLRLADSPQYKEFTITVSDSEGAQGVCMRRS